MIAKRHTHTHRRMTIHAHIHTVRAIRLIHDSEMKTHAFASSVVESEIDIEIGRRRTQTPSMRRNGSRKHSHIADERLHYTHRYIV